MAPALWRCESGSFALQKSRFYLAKPTLLERQTIGFTRHWQQSSYTAATLAKNIYTFSLSSYGILATDEALGLLPKIQWTTRTMAQKVGIRNTAWYHNFWVFILHYWYNFCKQVLESR